MTNSSAHARLSPSAASRWMACPGSVEAAERILALTGEDEHRSSPAAAEGTLAHEIAAARAHASLTGSSPPVEGRGGGEMMEHADNYTSLLLGLCTWRDAEWGIEDRVDVTGWVPGGWGTVDAWVADKSLGVLHVVDYKYGRGVRVPVADNPQLLIYALGIADRMNWDGIIRVHIYQPRHRPPHHRHHTITAAELRQWAGETLRPAAIIADKPGAPRKPGENQCRWCPARGQCPDLAEHLDASVLLALSSDDSASIDPTRAAELIRRTPAIVAWLAKVREAATLAAVRAGAEFPGLKLRKKRVVARRKWSNDAEEELVRALGDDAYQPRKLISITAAKRLIPDPAVISDLTITAKSANAEIAADEYELAEDN